MPLVSVLMSVFNGGDYLRESIESILGQTLRDFEFIIVDDGSTDNSIEIINSYQDPRIRLIVNKKNMGLSYSLNRGILLSNSRFVARMDCDDVSLPFRLSKQVAFMEANPEVGISGTWIKCIGQTRDRIITYPTEYHMIRGYMLFRTPFAHPSVIMRRELLTNYGLTYNLGCRYAQDAELWSRCERITILRNISEPLVLYRFHSNQIGQAHRSEQRSISNFIRLNALLKSNLLSKEQTILAHNWIQRWPLDSSRESVVRTKYWLEKLQRSNKYKHQYAEPAFSTVLGWRWLVACQAATHLGGWTSKKFSRSFLSQMSGLSWKKRMKFSTRCWLRRPGETWDTK